MPIYEFCCDACGNRFEELASAEAAENGGVACTGCGSHKVQRLFSAFSFSSSGSKPSSLGQSGCNSCSKTSCTNCG